MIFTYYKQEQIPRVLHPSESTTGFTASRRQGKTSQVRGIPPLYNLLKGIISAMQGMAWRFGCNELPKRLSLQ